MERWKHLIAKIPTGILSGVSLAVILWLTLAPHPTGDLKISLFPGADKVVHMVMFGFLTFMVLLDIMKHKGWQSLSLALIAVVAFITALLGIGIECAQRAMGLGRTFEVLDILADTAGSMAAAGIWAMLQGLWANPSDN